MPLIEIFLRIFIPRIFPFIPKISIFFFSKQISPAHPYQCSLTVIWPRGAGPRPRPASPSGAARSSSTPVLIAGIGTLFDVSANQGRPSPHPFFFAFPTTVRGGKFALHFATQSHCPAISCSKSGCIPPKKFRLGRFGSDQIKGNPTTGEGRHLHFLPQFLFLFSSFSSSPSSCFFPLSSPRLPLR